MKRLCKLCTERYTKETSDLGSFDLSLQGYIAESRENYEATDG